MTGHQRATTRLAEKAKANTVFYRDAAPMPVTRQQRRYAERKARKGK